MAWKRQDGMDMLVTEIFDNFYFALKCNISGKLSHLSKCIVFCNSTIFSVLDAILRISNVLVY